MMHQGRDKSPPFTVHQVSETDVITFTENKRDYEVDVFKCFHRKIQIGKHFSTSPFGISPRTIT